MIQQRFGNALHWYQVLVTMADQEVNTWVQNMTFTVMTSPDNTNATDHSSGIEISASTPETLGRTSTPFCQSDMQRRCTVDISSAAVPNMLFWNAKSSDFHVRPKCGGLY